MTTVTVSFRIPASVHAALKREAERQDRSLNKIVVMALSEVRTFITEEQIDAISEAESLVQRLAASYDVYGGIDLKALLQTLGKITGTIEEDKPTPTKKPVARRKAARR